MNTTDVSEVLVENLTVDQAVAVRSPARRLLVVAGAGSGKTEVMARRIAWWVAVEGVPRERIVAFTFTEKAAEEMKFRIRKWLGLVTAGDDDPTLGGMFVGTIHGFCIGLLRELQPDRYGMHDVLDEAGRLALVQRGFYQPLGLAGLKSQLDAGQYATIETFLSGYDLLNEYGALEVDLPDDRPPALQDGEWDWCGEARTVSDLGDSPLNTAFGRSAARYYAYLHARRFLDFSTSQSEFVRQLEGEETFARAAAERFSHVVVDEVQDLNPVQDRVVRGLVGPTGSLTAVGDHRQAIFGWRGGRVELMAALYKELANDSDGEVVELSHNFRSTPRIVNLANTWARTIGAVDTLASPDMEHGRTDRKDQASGHVAALHFAERDDEAEWIAATVAALVDAKSGTGAFHDTATGERGLSFTDIAVLTRSTTSVDQYIAALEQRDVPAVVRGGPDLFRRPEVLLLLGALGLAAGLDEFWGGWRGLPPIVEKVLGCAARPEAMIPAAMKALVAAGLPTDADAAERVALAAALIRRRLDDEPVKASEVDELRTPPLAKWLRQRGAPRRIFPQTLYQWLAAEVGVAAWDAHGGRGVTAMYHLGQLSALVTGLETPGWVSSGDLKYQVIALAQWGTGNARTDEAPLLVQPDAVTVSTIHSAKGLEFPVVILADVASQRFPSSRAKTVPSVPYDVEALGTADPADLADNDNYDDERRLMYVAVTRSQRYLFISSSGTSRSPFSRQIEEIVTDVGGVVGTPAAVPGKLTMRPSEPDEVGARLLTSFSDLRYYHECPHDYYLRKVLGFAPSIDQAFGYGRAVHNLLREIHRDPKSWSDHAEDPKAVEAAVQSLIERGLFYLRYTTGEPAERMRKRGAEIVTEYVKTYRGELGELTFEPEREFETLLDEAQVLVSGAIDLIRRDDPPQVTLIDFKSGEATSDLSTKLDPEEMRLQISLYAMAAKRELEYEPGLGLVRYLGELDPAQQELAVDFDEESLGDARRHVVELARGIQGRRFDTGPTVKPRDRRNHVRCQECDFLHLCGRKEAVGVKDGHR